MTLEEVIAEVESIKACAADDERAHSMEDALYGALLSAIAEGRCVDPAACAKAALATQKISFARWYA